MCKVREEPNAGPKQNPSTDEKLILGVIRDIACLNTTNGQGTLNRSPGQSEGCSTLCSIQHLNFPLAYGFLDGARRRNGGKAEV